MHFGGVYYRINTHFCGLPKWQGLRGNKLSVHFRRQQVIVGFIVDFDCHMAGLVVEVDGDIHGLQQEDDARREKVLRESGLRIVRFRNEDVLGNLPAVVGRITEAVMEACLALIEQDLLKYKVWKEDRA